VPDVVRAAIAEEVRAYMARRRLSQMALADRTGISSSTLSRRLLGESDVTVGELYRIAQVLGTDLVTLLGTKASA
ncbi:helix-turn-helix domain-containing protein, partial [Mycolicibacterium canariasense]|uniref:helix-turn-helix domain-containing protein n=1 Tax=Mycolicibacterium canariasense TaxID=228230 RepID=UPI0013F4EC22